MAININKAFTSVEQSKILSKILPIESADMCYIKHASSDNPTWRFDNDIPPMILNSVPINEVIGETLPCWSLTALLNALPELQGGKPMITLDDNYITYPHISGLHTKADNLIDACYEMMLKLYVPIKL